MSPWAPLRQRLPSLAVWALSPGCQSLCLQDAPASPLTSRSARRGAHWRWQEAASAELKTIRVDQRKCRAGWRAGQILISACWPHTSLHMSHPLSSADMLFGLGFAGEVCQAGLCRLTAQSSREAWEEGVGMWVRCGCPGALQEALCSSGTRDCGAREWL